jgi:hypothetical protein
MNIPEELAPLVTQRSWAAALERMVWTHDGPSVYEAERAERAQRTGAVLKAFVDRNVPAAPQPGDRARWWYRGLAHLQDMAEMYDVHLEYEEPQWVGDDLRALAVVAADEKIVTSKRDLEAALKEADRLRNVRSDL